MSSDFMLACLRLSAPSRPTPPATIRAAPGGAEGFADIVDEGGETAAQRLAPGHQHVVVIALRLKGPSGPERFFQPPPDPIALDRAADASGDGQADARARDGIRFGSRRAGLQREGLGRDAPAARHALKFGPPGQAAERFAGGKRPSIVAQGRLHVLGVAADEEIGRTAAEARRPRSGRELLAAARRAARR